MEVDVPLNEKIEKKQLMWYGHLKRMNEERIPLKVWIWRPKMNRFTTFGW